MFFRLLFYHLVMNKVAHKFLKTRDLVLAAAAAAVVVVVLVALDSIPRADSKDSKDYTKL